MSKKKAKKKKNRRGIGRRRNRKGVMPPALKAYWAEKRAQKNRRKANRRKKRNPPSTVMKRYRKGKLRSSSGRKVRTKKMAKAILLSELRSAGYDIAPKPNRRRKKNGKKKSPGLFAKLSQMLKGNPQRMTKAQLKRARKLGLHFAKA